MYLVLPETVPRVFHEALSKVFRADPNLRPNFADITAKIANFYESWDFFAFLLAMTTYR